MSHHLQWDIASYFILLHNAGFLFFCSLAVKSNLLSRIDIYSSGAKPDSKHVFVCCSVIFEMRNLTLTNLPRNTVQPHFPGSTWTPSSAHKPAQSSSPILTCALSKSSIRFLGVQEMCLDTFLVSGMCFKSTSCTHVEHKHNNPLI